MRQHKMNDQIRGVCSQPAASKIVQRAQLRWYGHVLRMENKRLPKQLLNYVPSNGQRRVGRQSERWIDNIKNYLNDSNIDYEDAETIAADRVFWRKFVASCN